MIARLIENPEGKIQLLCADGSVCTPTETILMKLLTDFKSADKFYGTDGVWNSIMPEMALVPGETFAVVTDEKQLLILDFSPFLKLVGNAKVNYISAQDYGAKHNKSVEIIKVYCRQDRILGAIKVGATWIIPEDAPYPVSPESRVKSKEKKVK